ncbi:MAG TPA: alpha/beta fold hydrolase [Salinimicrobium sp.]|nr:alpha/beta fold hydrolase [Salinimicrobium sp.]
MKLHSSILGEGKPLLILHGFMGMSDNWKTLGNQFSEAGFQVHLIDQRNHGRSPHSEEFSYNEMAKDVKEYCETHKLENSVILGHSMGGKTAMFASCFFPALFSKLIVVDIAPKYYAPHHEKLLEGLKMVDEAELSSRGDAEDLLEKYVEEKGVRLFLLKNLYWRTKEKLAVRLNLKVLIEKIEALGEALPSDRKYSKPALFIKGGNSGYIKGEDEALIKKHFPHSEIKIIPSAGHWVHAEKRKEFYDLVLTFLKK